MSDVRIPRRALFQLAFGAAIAGVSRRSFAEPARIVIAGGGIIGANLAYRLAKRRTVGLE